MRWGEDMTGEEFMEIVFKFGTVQTDTTKRTSRR